MDHGQILEREEKEKEKGKWGEGLPIPWGVPVL